MIEFHLKFQKGGLIEFTQGKLKYKKFSSQIMMYTSDKVQVILIYLSQLNLGIINKMSITIFQATEH